MMLLLVILIPLAGGLLALLPSKGGGNQPRWISLAALALAGIAALLAWVRSGGRSADDRWVAECEAPWVTAAGVRFHFAVDGFSYPLVLLTLLVGAVAVLVSWRGITEKTGFFHFNLLWVLGGALGVFLSLDLLVFFFFWELMILPMFLIIAIWGHERRRQAAVKFFIFTQTGGLLMLVSIIGLHVLHGSATGYYTFLYEDLLGHGVKGRAGFLLMLGLFAGFAVKLPAFPFHTWLADAHTEAPTAGSVVLAGLLLKTGAYGLVRFLVPLYPDASSAFAPVAMALGVAGVLYGAMLAFSQNDFKRLVACTSVSHMGFVLLGVFAWNGWSVGGVLMQMIAHGVSASGLFIVAGALQDRLHTRDLHRMGGLWTIAPRLAAFGSLFALATLGMPGLGNFIGEFLVLLGTFQVRPWFAVVGALSLVGSAVYALRLVQRTFHGMLHGAVRMPDIGVLETVVLAVLGVATVWLGIKPQPVFRISEEAVARLIESGLPAERPPGDRKGGDP